MLDDKGCQPVAAGGGLWRGSPSPTRKSLQSGGHGGVFLTIELVSLARPVVACGTGVLALLARVSSLDAIEECFWR